MYHIPILSACTKCDVYSNFILFMCIIIFIFFLLWIVIYILRTLVKRLSAKYTFWQTQFYTSDVRCVPAISPMLCTWKIMEDFLNTFPILCCYRKLITLNIIKKCIIKKCKNGGFRAFSLKQNVVIVRCVYGFIVFQDQPIKYL